VTGADKSGAVVQPQHLVAGGVALLIAVASGIWFGGRPADPVPVMIERQPTPGTQDSIIVLTVHVSGAVVRPGLVELAEGARTAEALIAAGGALPEADLSSMNLAAPVMDGTMIVVPLPGQDPDSIARADDGRVRINTASTEDITSLPGIGPVLAERIAEYRDENGPFSAVEDLLDVPGIGESKLAALRDSVIVP
jgi:competence protein ComEA